MKSVKSWQLLAAVFALYFLLEYGMNAFSEDAVPVWKILLVGLISAYVSFSFLFKRGKNYSFYSISSYKKRRFPILQAEESSFLQLVSHAKETAYSGLTAKAESLSIRFYTKRNTFDTGTRFRIEIGNNQMIIKARPRFFMQIIDDGGKIESQMDALVEKLIHLKLIAPTKG